MADTKLYNITSANATAVLVVKDLFPQGIRLEGFATDQSISQGALVISESRQGVDGNHSAGYLPSLKVVTIMLEAASPSFTLLAEVFSAMDKNKKIYDCTLNVTIPAIGKTITWSAGTMTSGQPFPDLKKLIDPTTWVFTFGNMS